MTRHLDLDRAQPLLESVGVDRPTIGEDEVMLPIPTPTSTSMTSPATEALRQSSLTEPTRGSRRRKGGMDQTPFRFSLDEPPPMVRRSSAR